jgi:hypothetical protein
MIIVVSQTTKNQQGEINCVYVQANMLFILENTSLKETRNK